jgi:Skp family chaperone for outer membrane proteins
MKTTFRIFSLALVAFTSLYASESGQGNITRRQLKSLTATASTQADHRKLAVYYEQEVQRETAEAQKAEQELNAEQAHPVNRITKNQNGRLNYFQYQLEHHRKAAEKAQSLAAVHEEKAGMAPGAVSIAQSSTATHDCCAGSCCTGGRC